MTRALIGATLLALLAYGAWEAHPLLAGPGLTIITPTNGSAYEGGVVTIEGRVTRVVALTLDGSPVLPDKEGHFVEALAFPRGGSILTFTATDRFGRMVKKERTIYVP